MNLGEAIGVAGGIAGLGAALWKVFNGIADLRLRIQHLDDAIDVQTLAINGVKERGEHTNKRTVEAAKKMYLRLNHIENWLTKNSKYEPDSDR
jgi:hypothetical protein